METEFYAVSKEDFDKVVQKESKTHDFYAPVKQGPMHNFQKIHSTKEMDLNYQLTYHPAKRIFFETEQKMFEFDGNKIKTPEFKQKNIIIFGLRKCDLNSIARQDTVFDHIHQDIYYIQNRKNSLLIGLQCRTHDQYCFCGSMELRNEHDLMFYEREKAFIVEARNEKGKEFIQRNSKQFKKTNIVPDNKIEGTDRLQKKDISQLYNHPDWEKGAKDCLSCTACNHQCPSCYCFEVCDEVSMHNPKTGERKRQWSSCQLQKFTRVAGGHIFRDKRIDRFKHRIYHQLQYFKDRHKVNLCSGCGRCIRHCPTKIDFIKIINEMK